MCLFHLPLIKDYILFVFQLSLFHHNLYSYFMLNMCICVWCWLLYSICNEHLDNLNVIINFASIEKLCMSMCVLEMENTFGLEGTRYHSILFPWLFLVYLVVVVVFYYLLFHLPSSDAFFFFPLIFRYNRFNSVSRQLAFIYIVFIWL